MLFWGGPTLAQGGAAAWSDTPFSPAIFENAPQNAEFTLERLKVDALTLGRTHLRVESDGARIEARLLEADLAGGAVTGGATLRRGDAPDPQAVELIGSMALNGDGVALEQLTKALRGRAAFSITVDGAGLHQRALMGALSGSGEVRVREGAVTAPALTDTGLAAPFDQASATFEIVDGVLRSEDIRVDGPWLSFRGSGTIDLANRQLDLTLWPGLFGAVAASPPLRIQGPWEAPVIGLQETPVRPPAP